jgi:hypothetical protein
LRRIAGAFSSARGQRQHPVGQRFGGGAGEQHGGRRPCARLDVRPAGTSRHDDHAPRRLRHLQRDPHFAHKIHVGRPNLVDRERLMQRISEVLDRHWFTNNGPMVQEFEERLASWPA